MKRKFWLLAVAMMLATLVAGPMFVAAADEKKPATETEQSQGADSSKAQVSKNAASPAPATATLSRGSKKADEPEPKKAQAKPQTLAGLAAGINIDLPKDEGKSIVITNDNLQTMSEGAVITEANNAGDYSDMPEDSRREDASKKRQEEMEDARSDVRRLKSQLDSVQTANEQNRAVNTYNGSGPQYRAGGQVNPLEAQQDKLKSDLNEANNRLKSLENAEARANQRRPSSEDNDS